MAHAKTRNDPVVLKNKLVRHSTPADVHNFNSMKKEEEPFAQRTMDRRLDFAYSRQ